MAASAASLLQSMITCDADPSGPAQHLNSGALPRCGMHCGKPIGGMSSSPSPNPQVNEHMVDTFKATQHPLASGRVRADVCSWHTGASGYALNELDMCFAQPHSWGRRPRSRPAATPASVRVCKGASLLLSAVCMIGAPVCISKAGWCQQPSIPHPGPCLPGAMPHAHAARRQHTRTPTLTAGWVQEGASWLGTHQACAKQPPASHALPSSVAHMMLRRRSAHTIKARP
jgi:hypothetical protein